MNLIQTWVTDIKDAQYFLTLVVEQTESAAPDLEIARQEIDNALNCLNDARALLGGSK